MVTEKINKSPHFDAWGKSKSYTQQVFGLQMLQYNTLPSHHSKKARQIFDNSRYEVVHLFEFSPHKHNSQIISHLAWLSFHCH